MPVPVVVDGYNLLYALGESPSAPARSRLVTDLGRWARARQHPVVLVFDAWAGGAREAREEVRGPVTVHFTRHGERADQFIVRWVATHHEAVVVTSDREVQQGARRRGAAVLGADAFAQRLLAVVDPEAEPPEVPPPRAAVRGRQARWLAGL